MCARLGRADRALVRHLPRRLASIEQNRGAMGSSRSFIASRGENRGAKKTGPRRSGRSPWRLKSPASSRPPRSSYARRSGLHALVSGEKEEGVRARRSHELLSLITGGQDTPDIIDARSSPRDLSEAPPVRALGARTQIFTRISSRLPRAAVAPFHMMKPCSPANGSSLVRTFSPGAARAPRPARPSSQPKTGASVACVHAYEDSPGDTPPERSLGGDNGRPRTVRGLRRGGDNPTVPLKCFVRRGPALGQARQTSPVSSERSSSSSAQAVSTDARTPSFLGKRHNTRIASTSAPLGHGRAGIRRGR